MGQYYVIANIDKKEYIKPEYMKLMEFSWQNSYAIAELLAMLEEKWAGDRISVVGDYAENIPKDVKEASEKWLEENPNEAKEYEEDGLSLYSWIHEDFKEIKSSSFTLRTTKESKYIRYDISMEEQGDVKKLIKRKRKGKVVLFEDSGTYIHLDRYYKKEVERRIKVAKDKLKEGEELKVNTSWLENPVSILLATNDGHGGGDYRGRNAEHIVGLFGWNRVKVIGAKSPILKDYEDFTEKIIVDENFIPEPTFDAEDGIEGEDKMVV